MINYSADYEFKSSTCKQRCNGGVTYFKAYNIVEAVLDFDRWFKNRHTNVPDFFEELLSVKIREFKPNKIEPNGYLQLPYAGVSFEWKHDNFRGISLVESLYERSI